MTRIVTITSGKTGVGKTTIALNLGIQLSRRGHRVCLFDADFGFANIDTHLGIDPRFGLKDVLVNDGHIGDIIIKDQHGIDILPGRPGIEEIVTLDMNRIDALINHLSELKDYDFLFFDTSAGISKNVLSISLASAEIILIITPEPASSDQAVKMMEILSSKGFKGDVKVIVNQCQHISIARNVYKQFKSSLSDNLPQSLSILGFINYDSKITEAFEQKSPLVSIYPDSIISEHLKQIAERMVSGERSQRETSDMSEFWGRLIQIMRHSWDFGGEPGKPEGSKDEIEDDPQKNGDPVSFDPSFLPMMEKLIGSVTAVSRELGHFRTTLREESRTHPQEIAFNSDSRDDSYKEPIRLDLQGFLKTVKQKRKKS